MSTRSPLTLVLNIPPHYREPIFKLIENNWECRWIFGENKTDIPSCPLSFMRNVTILPISKGKINTWWLKGLSGILWKEQPRTIVITGEIKFLGSWAVMIRNRFRPKSRRARIFLWSHGWDGTEKKLRRLFYRIYFGMADGLLLYGEHSQKIAQREGIVSSKIKVVHNSLDHDRFLSLRQSLSASLVRMSDSYYGFKNAALPTLIYIGRLSLIKKIGMLVHAVAALKASGNEVNAVIVGDGPDYETLNKIAEELNISDNIKFLGAKYDIADTAPLIYNADMCVSPGHIGLTAIHSLELGTPVITHSDFSTQAPEVEAVIPGVTGQLFRCNDQHDLVKAISRQLDLNKSVGRDAVRNECYNAVEAWTPSWQLNAFKKAID